MSNQATAQAVETHAQNIAEHACTNLLEKHADIAQRFGSNAKEVWTAHLQQRLMELTTALEAGDFGLFTSRLAWSRSAMRARGVTAADLDASLEVLCTSITTQLDDADARVALEYITQAANAVEQTTASPLKSTLDAGIPLDRLALQYVQTVVAGNVLPGMQLVFDAVAHGTTLSEALLRVLLPAQHEVGRLWHLNELSVSEEHLVSYTTQRLMAALASQAPRSPDNGYTAVAGAVAGNVHDIGIRAITYLLENEGWRTIYLGSDIPQVELPNTIDSFEADVLLLSVALSSQIRATTRTIETIRANCKRPVKIMVGGNGLIERESLWKETGADGYAANANSALSMAWEFAAKS